MIKNWDSLIVGVGSFILLFLGIWEHGLWDPWEMNRAHLARKMAEAPKVLVIEGGGSTTPGSIAHFLSSTISEDATIVSAKDASDGASPIETGRGLLSETVFRAVVFDVDIRLKSSDDTEGIRSLGDFLGSVIPNNGSTTFFLISLTGSKDIRLVLNSVISYAQTKEKEDPEYLRQIMERQVVALDSINETPEKVLSSLRLDAFTTQYKYGGKTVFTPPLDPFILSLIFRAFGINEFSARLPGVIFAVLILVLMFTIGKRIYGRSSALVCVGILVSTPMFFESARFVGNQLSTMFFLSLGVVAFGGIVRETHRIYAYLVLMASTILIYLSAGLMGVAMLASCVVFYPILARDLRKSIIIGSGAVLGISVCLVLLSYLVDSPFFQQFRFYQPTFAGGMPLTSRAFDFAIKQVGFGLFPWSALLPLAVMGFVGTDKKNPPEDILLTLWAVGPFILLMVFIRPLHLYYYAGVPALAWIIGLYLMRMEDEPIETRKLAFFSFGLFAVMMKDLFQSPAPLISFLTTDPTFSDPGKGELVFPEMKIGFWAMVLVIIAGLAILICGARLITVIKTLPSLLSQGNIFKYVLISVITLIVVDIIVFIALKWDIIFLPQPPDVEVGAVVLRIFLTGPDIAFLYLLLIAIIGFRYSERLKELRTKVISEKWWTVLVEKISNIEKPRHMLAILGISAGGLFIYGSFFLTPELSFHLSQKHIMETYQKSSKKIAGELFRHGVFAGKGNEDMNFYTGLVKEMNSRTEMIERLKDQSRRTFFIVPKTQWSEINYAFRTASGGRHAYVLDDRSSRFILVVSSLAQDEEDANWIAKATITEGAFKELSDVIMETVNFEDKIKFLGYSIDSHSVRRGGTAKIKMYFQCSDKIGTSYRVFMHIDRIGSSSRIHGDHWILNLVKETEEQSSCVGCYATTHWLKGDIIVDDYAINIPIGSPSGPHDIWIGFYNPNDDRRLKVKDFDKSKIRHDGQNRVSIGVLTVE